MRPPAPEDGFTAPAGLPPELRAIRAVCEELGALGVAVVTVAAGAGLAVAVVSADLIVWCDGRAFSWWSGQTTRSGSLHRYAFHPAADPVTAARRIARRYAGLRHGDRIGEQVLAALAAAPGNLLFIGPFDGTPG